METGDPKQLAVLAVMAVGALGFLVTRLGGKHDAPSQAKASASRSSVPRTAVAFNLVHDPFSHPRLAPKMEKPESVPSVALETKKRKSFSLIGSLPPADDAPLVVPIAPKKTKAEPLKPTVPESTIVGLEAIAGASDAVAFLTVGNAESLPFHPHQIVAGTIRLLSVGDGEVVLSGPKGPFTLGVGERKTL